MSLVDRTNEDIDLSLEDGVELTIDADADSSCTPSQWVWLMFSGETEPWYKITYDEAEKMHDRLGRILGKVAA